MAVYSRQAREALTTGRVVGCRRSRRGPTDVAGPRQPAADTRYRTESQGDGWLAVSRCCFVVSFSGSFAVAVAVGGWAGVRSGVPHPAIGGHQVSLGHRTMVGCWGGPQSHGGLVRAPGVSRRVRPKSVNRHGSLVPRTAQAASRWGVKSVPSRSMAKITSHKCRANATLAGLGPCRCRQR